MSNQTENAAQHQRLRPFRIAAYATYLTAVGVFSLLIILSVVKSVMAMTPRHPAAAENPLGKEECLALARSLWTDLDQHRQQLSSAEPAASADNAWTPFRNQWVVRQREGEARCASDDEQRQLFRRLDRLMNLYTTHTVQYAGEIGPTLDKLRATLGTP